MNDNQLYIVFAVEHYNTTGIIRSLGQKGINPVYIAIKNKARVSSTSKYVSRCHHVDSVEEGFKLLVNLYGKEYLKGKKPILFFIDDKTVSYVDYHYDELKDLFIFFNAGEAGKVNYYMDKYNVQMLAEKYGVNTLKSYRCKKGEITEYLEYPIITKSISPAIGGWKSDVFVCNSEDELVEAYKKIKADTVLIQPYIDKTTEIEIYGLATNKGNDVHFTFELEYNYVIPAYYSPYMTIYKCRDKSLVEALKKMMKEIGFEGLMDAEFIVDKNGKMYFTEFNFRNAAWGYASTVAGMNLPYLWAKEMLRGSSDEADYFDIEEPFTQMCEPIDYQKRVVEGNMDFTAWIIEVVGCKSLCYYNSDDMEPFYEMIRNNEVLR